MRRKRLAGKLRICAVGVTSLLVLMVCALNFYWAYRIVVQISEERAASQVEGASMRIQSVLQEKSRYAWTLSQEERIRQFVRNLRPGEHPEQTRELTRTLQRIAERDTRIVSVYLAVAKTNVLYGNQEFDYPKDYDVASRVWYQEASRRKGIIFTNPYLCPLTGKEVLTTAAPILDSDGSTMAVVCVDVLVDELETILGRMNIFKEGVSFMLDSDGKPVISSMRDGEIRSNTLFRHGTPPDPILETLREAHHVPAGMQASLSVQGRTHYVFHAPIKLVNWTVGFIVPESEIIAPLLDLGRLSGVTVLAGLVILYLLVTILTSRLVAPVRTLSELTQRVALGDYGLRARVDSDDELGELADGLNHMLDKQQELIDHTVKTAYRMGLAGQKLMVKIGEARLTLPLVTGHFGRFLSADGETEEQERLLSPLAPNITRFLDKSGAIQERACLLNELSERLAATVAAGRVQEPTDRRRLLGDLDRLTRETRQLIEQYTSVQADFVDLTGAHSELRQKYQEVSTMLHIVRENLSGVAAMQTETVDAVMDISHDLVEWSHVLLQKAVRYNILPDGIEPGGTPGAGESG